MGRPRRKKELLIALDGHELPAIRAAYPLPAKLIAEVREMAEKAIRARWAPFKYTAGPAVIVIAALAVLAMTAPQHAPMAGLAVFYVLAFLVQFVAKEDRGVRVIRDKPHRVVHLAENPSWRTLGLTLGLTRPGDPLLGAFVQTAITLDESRQKAAAQKAELQERIDNCHPPATWTEILESREEQLRETTDSQIKHILLRQIERLRHGHATSLNMIHTLEWIDLHLSALDKAEARLLELAHQTSATHEVSEETRQEIRLALPKVIAGLPDSEGRVLSALHSLPPVEEDEELRPDYAGPVSSA